MSNFRFTLSSVQKLRQRLRDDAAKSLQQSQRAIDQLNEHVQQLLADVNEQVVLQSQANQGLVHTQKLLESQRYQLHLLNQIEVAREKISLIQQERQRRHQILIQKEQDVRALEKLQHSQWQHWQQAEAARQQYRLDEWASYRHWESASQLPGGSTGISSSANAVNAQPNSSNPSLLGE
ncbi:MAG: flagellar export protein FliJ [Pirellulaceae bacterium]|nr:flagellar export protein FliJ [Pirellulaceae bacterium]